MKRNWTNWKERLWEKGRIQRHLSLFLVAVLVTTQCTMSKGVPLVTAQTSCPNHTEHDESCGYVEPTGAAICDHVCDESCTGKKLNCVHTEHTGECGYQAEVSGFECNHNCEDGTCSYVAAVEAVACNHEHNDACEYNAEAESCNHTCEDGICSFAEAAEGTACDHQHEESVCGYTEGTPEQPCTHEHGTECYEEVTECQHNCLDGECSFKAAAEGAECTHNCAECNPKVNEEEELTEVVVDETATVPAMMSETVELAEGDVALNSTNFPDPKFLEYVSSATINTTQDGVLTAKELEAVQTINLGGAGATETSEAKYHECTDLTGIEYFINLKTLNCDYGEIDELDLSKNIALVTLQCGHNNLQSLDLSNNKNLLNIYCGANEISSLNISGLEEVRYLSFWNNQIESIDVSALEDLVQLTCDGNQLISLDVSQNANLKEVRCFDNKLTSLKLGTNTNLNNVLCYNNHLAELDVSGLSSLDILEAYGQNLGVLPLSYDSGTVRWVYDAVVDVSGISKNFTPTKTSFYSDSAFTTPISVDLDFQVDRNGVLSARKVVPVTRPVYFKTVLADETNTLSGSFIYTASSELSAVAGTIEVNEAKELENESELSKYVTVNSETETYEISCADFENIASGIPGQYDIIITSGENFCVATLEVVLEINDVNFPDEKFQEHLKKYIAGAGDDVLTAAEIKNIIIIDLCGKKYTDPSTAIDHTCNHTYTSLQGIEYFTSLTELYCGKGTLEELDVKNLNELRVLECCSNKELRHLELKNNTKLTFLDCSSCGLKELNLNQNIDLQDLRCVGNELKELDLRKNEYLGYLNCSSNQLSELSLTNNKNLVGIVCDTNFLSSLDVSELELTKFVGHDQKLGPLSMYTNTTGEKYINTAKNSEDIAVKFMEGTTFKTSSGITLNNESNFYLEDGVLTVGASVQNPGTVSFSKTLEHVGTIACNLSGTFDYNVQAVTATDGYLDISAVDSLTEEELLSKFTVTTNDEESAVITTGLSLGNNLAELKASIRTGGLGEYPITLKYNGGDCTTRLTVAVEINDTNFPDTTFRGYIKDNSYDTSGDGILTREELNEVKEISLVGEPPNAEENKEAVLHQAENLIGIEFFTNLETLNCEYGNLTYLDVSKNTKLSSLTCNDNKLTELDLTNNTLLTRLVCTRNSLTELELSRNIKLEMLYCGINNLRKLNVSGLSELTILSCYWNKIEHLDVSSNKKLYQLSVADNRLESLDVRSNVLLNKFGCNNNNLTSLNISNNTELTILDCSENSLTCLDISGLKNLETLDASNQVSGSLSMYYETDENGENGVWVNSSKNADDIVRTFASGTVFSASGTELDCTKYYMNNEGKWTVTPNAENLGIVGFSKELVKHPDADASIATVLEGTFSYCTIALEITDGYIDVNDAVGLSGKSQLLPYFRVLKNGTEGTEEIAVADLDISIKMDDWINIQNGVVGRYPVTIKYNDILADTVLELGVAINETNFPDNTFRTHVLKYNTVNEDIKVHENDETEIGFLTQKELQAVTYINLEGTSTVPHKCENVRGIEYFTNLQVFDAKFGSLTELNVENNQLLTIIYLRDNHVEVLDLRANKAVHTLTCEHNGLKSLYVSGLNKLETLQCDNGGPDAPVMNQLKVLDLTGCTSLRNLLVSHNQLNAIDISQSLSLETLNVSGNTGMTDLEISNHSALKNLYVSNTNITEINLKNAVKLNTLYCQGSIIEELDLSKNPNLTQLYVTGSIHLKYLDLSNNTLLQKLDCSNIGLTKLDLRKQTQLTDLDCSVNELTQLELSNNEKLTYLNCNFNKLSKIDIDHLNVLETFYAGYQNIGKLNLYCANDGSGEWNNEAKNSGDRVAYFSSTTVFCDTDASGSQIKTFLYNTDGSLKTSSPSSLPETIYFVNTLDTEGKWSINGTFNCDAPTAIVSNGYIDIIDAKGASDAELLEVFTIKKNDGTDSEVDSNLAISISGESINAIKEGVIGRYPVTVTTTASDQTTYDIETILQVGLEINRMKEDQSEHEHFPDDTFRAHVTKYDTDGETPGFFTAAELEAVKTIDLEGTSLVPHTCKNIQGVQYFTNLIILNVKFGELTELNLEDNTLLQVLFARDNYIEQLDLTNNKELREVTCEYNGLKKLYVKGLSKLGSLQCDNGGPDAPVMNQLKELDLTGCTALRNLLVSYNQLESLDVSENTELVTLGVSGNPQLKALNLSNNNKIKNLYCYQNGLTTLDISNQPSLTLLWCYDNSLTSLDLSNNPKINDLRCQNNKLSTLDISNLYLGTFIASGQEIDTLALHYNTTDHAWVNVPSAGYAYTEFLTDTTFKNSSGTVLPKETHYVNSAGAFSTTSGTPLSNVNFVSITKDANGTEWDKLSGKFSYEIPSTAVLNGYVDVNRVSISTTAADLAQYFTVITDNTTTTPSTNTAGVVTFKNSSDLTDNIQKKVLGQYPVTVAYGGNIYDAVLEIGVDINYQTGGTYVNFPNQSFRTYVGKYDTGFDKEGFLTYAELSYVTDIDLGGTSGTGHTCENVVGIQYFENLKKLECQYGVLTTLDVSALKNLESLNCSYNTGLQTATGALNVTLAEQNMLQRILNTTSNDVLKELTCDGIGITTLNVSALPNLTKLSCAYNNLTTLDVSANTALTELKCSNNKLGSFGTHGLTENEALNILYCSNNSLDILELTDNISLTEVYCDNNQLDSLDVSMLSGLTRLSCDGNQLTYLNVDGLGALVSVSASNQTVTDPLSMEYGDSLWCSTALLSDGRTLRTFQSLGTEFYSYSYKNGAVVKGTQLNGFGVNASGILTIDPSEEVTGDAYFVTSLNSSKGWSLNGTFSYDPEYLLEVHNVFYTSQEMTDEGMESEADLNRLPRLLSVIPDLESFILSEVVMEMAEVEDDGNEETPENTFENLNAGKEGTYTYKASLNNADYSASYTGYLTVVNKNAVISADRGTYLYAKNFFIGLSGAANLDAQDVLTKAAVSYGYYNGGMLNTIIATDSQTSFEIDDEELDAIQTAKEEGGTGAGDYPLTISYKGNAGQTMKTIIYIRVINDDVCYLVEIPKTIALTREPGAAYAEAEETIKLHKNVDQILTNVVEVSTAPSFELNDDIYKKEKLLIGVYTLDNSTQPVKYMGEAPLAVLDADNLEKAFRLISGDVTKLKYSDYTGTMEFTITYGGWN